MDLSRKSKAQLLKLLEQAQCELSDAEDAVQEANDKIFAIEEELGNPRTFMLTETILALVPFVEKLGTWREQDILHRIIHGERIDEEECQRINTLGIQFLHQLVL